ncbi:MAG: hypothetical protein P4K93_07390 [Terracidiphilus sp.]|nr:hypothetical protein [Terracidiphilus sp.]
MAVDTSAVQITINVVDGNSGEVVSKVTQSLGQLGAAGATTGQRVKEGMGAAGAGASSAREKVHLLTEEFGIHLPRAFRGIIAESKAAQTALSMVGTALIGLGAIQIGAMVFTQLYEGVKKLYEEYVDVNKSVDEYIQKAGEAAGQKLFDTASFETANGLLREANLQISELENKKKHYIDANAVIEGMGNGMYPGAMPMRSFTPRDDKELALQYQNRDAAKARAEELAVQMEEKGVEAQNSYASATAQAWQRSNVETQNAINLAKKHLDVTQAHEKSLYETTRALRMQQDLENRTPENQRIRVHEVDPNAGKAEYDQEVAIGKLRAKADSVAFGRMATEERIKLHNEATNASLRGEALYREQAKQQIDELTRKHVASEEAVNDVWAKFHADEKKRLEDQIHEVQKLREQTSLSGLTGVPRIQQEEKNRVNDVFDPRSHLDPGQRLASVNEIHKQTNIEISTAQDEFTRHIDELADQSATHQVSGFQRINAEAKRQIDDLLHEYEKLYGKNKNAPLYQAHVEELNRGVGIIGASANHQTSDLSHRNTSETEQIESEARAKLLSAEKNQTAAIEAEYEERLRKYKEQRRLTEISDEDYNRRAIAAEQIKDAQLVEASRAAREKMAREFSRFFSNPMQAMKEFGDKAAGEAAAALVQRMQAHIGNVGNAAQGTPGGVFDRIAGTAAGHGANAHETATHSAASAMISVGTAQISIGGANLALGGGGSAVGLGSANTFAQSSFSTSGGSTGLSASMGGASEPGGSTAVPTSFSGSTSADATAPSGVGTALGNTQQGLGLFSQGKSTLGGLFGGKKSTSDADAGFAETQSVDLSGSFNKAGNFSLGKSGTGMLNGGGVGANAMGAAGGAMGLFGAYEGNGGVGGALSGAMSGMQLGMSLGGPIGAAIGAVGGAVLGAIGFGGREKARVYDLKQVRPRIANDFESYQQGGMDYLSAYSDVQSLDMEAKKTTRSMGPAAGAYYNDTIKKEIQQAEAKFTGEQKAGRSQFTSTAAQYDWGGPIDNFGSYGDGVDHGMIRAQRGEFMVEQQQAGTHAGALNAINSGATYADMAKYYGADSTSVAPASSSGGEVHLHLSAIDAKSSMQFLMANKHAIRSAVNASYADNSGGADA